MPPRLQPSLTQPLKAATRAFSSSAPARAPNVSNVGKRPITIPPNVQLTATGEHVTVAGPLGTTVVRHPPYMVLKFPDPQTMTVAVEDMTNKKQRSWWGTFRTYVHNAIVGMTEGFSTPVYLVGVGYRAAMEADPLGKREGWSGQRLNMKLGYSHPVYERIPDWVKVEVETPTKIMVSCTDKQKLGLFAAAIRKNRVPEPFKGKGIFVGKERIRIKSVKKK
ncbi:hypothetical protein EIP86_008668 [Pleurotus ostreatoroseus]|nr:hypothetical protein EIP86_008668 [Pleurotus ostreatoroseus]